MINKLNHMFSRLSAQFLKPTLALLASLAVGAIGSVWASGTGYEDWTPEVQDSDGDYLVSNPLNWYGTEGAGCNPSWALRFDGETGYVTFDQMMEIGHYIWVGKVAGSSYGANWLVWKSKDGTTSYGFNQGSEKFCIADNDGQEARLKIESGRYTTATESNTGRGMLLGSGTGTADFWQTGGELIVNGKAVMGGGSGTCSVTLDGGVFAANTITRDGGTGTLTFTLNGGTIKSLADSSDFIASGISITVGSNGGTIDVGENAVTIAATLTGAGPIIKKGSGTLMFTGDMSGFTGSIINAEGGVVKLPTGAAATAGVGTSKTDDGSNAIFASTAYAWTGAANDGNWSTPGNWAVGGIQAASYPGSSGGATTEPTENVYIGKKVAITLSSDKKAYVYSIRLGEEVTFTGGGEIFLERSLGPGMLRLNGISLQVPRCGRSDRATGKLEIHNDVEICGDSTNYLGVYKNSDNNYAQTATIYGNLRGSGKLEVEVTGTSGTGFNWYNRGLFIRSSDNSKFSGEIEVKGDPNGSCLYGAGASSRTAAWTFVSGTRDGYNYVTRNGSDATFYFGSLSGSPDFNGNSTGENQTYNQTFVVGGRNEACSFGGRVCRSGYTNALIKEGTADCLFTGSNIATVDIQGGTFILGSSTPFLNTGKVKFSGGAISVAEDVEVDVPYYLDGTSTAPVVYDDRSYSKTWTSTLSKERVPNGFVKKGNGTLTLSAKPTYTSSTTVEAGTLVMPSGTTVADAVITGGTLQIAQGSTITKLAMTGGKIEVPIVGQVSDTTILTITELADGTTLTTDNFTYPASVTLTLDTTTTPGAVLVKASRSVQNYVWTPTSGTAFETLGNWRVNGEVPIEAPYPTIDTIEFPAEGAPWTVALADDATVASVAVNGAVTLTGAKLLANAFTGTAAITLDGNAGIGDFEPTADITISNPIVVSGTGNSINSNVKSVTVSGAISGGGVLSLLGANGNAVVILTGNNSAFEGTMYMDNSTCATLASDTAGSAKAKWVLNNSSTRNPVTGPKRGAYTVHFGELSGTYNHVAASGNEFYNILYVGALGSDFALGGSLAPASNFDRSETLHKVGDGTMTLSATRAKNLYCDGGVLYLTVAPLVYSEGAVSFNGGTLRLNALAAAEDLSGKVKNSTSAISVDIDSGVNAAWGSAIANSNTAGLTKKGDGTLTLDAAPEYTGKTKVEAGALYIIDGEYTLDLDPGTAEVTTDKDGYRKFVPASVAISGMVFLLF